MWDDENYHEDIQHWPILKADIEWAHGIMLMLRDINLPDDVKHHVDTFIDHFNRVYE